MSNYIFNKKQVQQDYQDGEVLDDVDNNKVSTPSNISFNQKISHNKNPPNESDSEDVIREVIQQPKKDKKIQKIQVKNKSNYKPDVQNSQSQERQNSIPSHMTYIQSRPQLYHKQYPYYPMIYLPHSYNPYPQNHSYILYPNQIQHQTPLQNYHNQPQIWPNQSLSTNYSNYQKKKQQNQQQRKEIPQNLEKKKLCNARNQIRKQLINIKDKQQLLDCLKKLIKNNVDQQSLKILNLFLQKEQQKQSINNILSHLQMIQLGKKIREKKEEEKLVGDNQKSLNNLLKDPRRTKK